MTDAKRFCIAAKKDGWRGFVAFSNARRPSVHTTQFVEDAYVCSRESAAAILRNIERAHPSYTFEIVEAPERAP